MSYFRLVVEGGHVGAGKSVTLVRYLAARDIVEALRCVRHLPRMKGKRHLTGLQSLEEIAHSEYLRGIEQQKRDPYHSRRGN